MSKPSVRKVRALLVAAVLATATVAATVPVAAAPADAEVSARPARGANGGGNVTFQGFSWL